MFDRLAREKAQAKAASALSGVLSSLPADRNVPAAGVSSSAAGGGTGTPAGKAAGVSVPSPQGGTIDIQA